MSTISHLECSKCGKRFDADKLWNLCTECKKPLFVRYDLEEAKKTLKKDTLKDRTPNMWRYREVLPVKDEENILTLGEGYTPLFRTERLGKEIGAKNLYIKEEGLNPTGSFKARGLGMAISKAKELGVSKVSIPSAGNAAGAMSAYASLAGMDAYVYMPKDVPKTFIAECKTFGAEIKLVKGVITDCGKVAAEEVEKFKRFDMSTCKEPYRIEGKKTMGYELAEQLDWELPDVIIYPTGGGTGIIGMWKAFDEMEELGWIGKKRPRMVTVQSDGCAPIVRAFYEGKEYADKWDAPETLAAGLKVPVAVGDFLILKALNESKGTAVAVSDEEIIDGAYEIGRTQGIYACPEGGATLIALRHLMARNWIDPKEKVVLFNTGTGLKYAHLWA